MQLARVVLALVSSASVLEGVGGKVVINEVADSGSSGACSGGDWIELLSLRNSSIDISGYKLCDSKGCEDLKAYTFPSGSTLAAGEYKLLCRGADGFAFGIGGDDTVTLQDAAGNVLDTSGALEDQGGVDITWARIPDGTGGFFYTWQPTPGAPNVFKEPEELKHCTKLYTVLTTGDKCEAPWTALLTGEHRLLPTESSVGHAWVIRQMHDDFETLEDSKSWMASHEFPVVLHNGQFYLTDRHHHSLALELSGFGKDVTIILKIVCDYSAVPAERFWAEMVDNKYALAADWSDDAPEALPKSVDFSKMPTSWSLSDYGDNQWRSLAGFASHTEVDNERCYVKMCEYFIDFGWAYLFTEASTRVSDVWPSDAPTTPEEFLSSLRALPRRLTKDQYDEKAWNAVAAELLPLCHAPAVQNHPLPKFFPSPTLKGWSTVPLPADPSCSPSLCSVGLHRGNFMHFIV